MRVCGAGFSSEHDGKTVNEDIQTRPESKVGSTKCSNLRQFSETVLNINTDKTEHVGMRDNILYLCYNGNLISFLMIVFGRKYRY